MFRIRRIFDDTLSGDDLAISQVKTIFKERFDLITEEDIQNLGDKLLNPLRYRFRTIIYVAEDQSGDVKGFSITAHMPGLNFYFLDFISTARDKTGRGIGGALYERLREEAQRLRVVGIFFECVPDTPELCPCRDLLKENAARLAFYERYGARPIVGTAYETPLKPDDSCPPHLVFDDLGQNIRLRRSRARRIVRAILERKYGDRCPPGYIDRVVGSFRDDPVNLRPPRYQKKMARMDPGEAEDYPIALVVSDQHQIHHVRERGYVEAPVRIDRILAELDPSRLFTRLRPNHYGLHYITAVHATSFVAYLGKACAKVEAKHSIYPYVFPIRNASRPPKELPIRAGYYCIDTFTPLNKNAYTAARRAVDCSLTAAEAILEGGFQMAYALIRPPGHHAERKVFGGFCYFNSAAVAGHELSHYGKVTILDIDYHHGNGTQDIFYDRPDVLTVSIHGHPRFAYPYFSGYADEKGAEEGLGYNLNLPLPEHGVDGVRFRETLKQALRRISKFQPRFLVVSLGLDAAKGDPTGTWLLTARDFRENGRMIGALHIPVLVVQEGGYRTRSLGVNVRHFFQGLHSPRV